MLNEKEFFGPNCDIFRDRRMMDWSKSTLTGIASEFMSQGLDASHIAKVVFDMSVAMEVELQKRKQEALKDPGVV